MKASEITAITCATGTDNRAIATGHIYYITQLVVLMIQSVQAPGPTAFLLVTARR